MPPFIAVITSVYDAGEINGLLKTFRSIKSQGTKRIIWYLGLKTDFISKLPTEIVTDSQVIIQITNDNSIYEAWNKILFDVTQKWVLFLGAGDILANDFDLSFWENTLIQNPHTDIVFGNCILREAKSDLYLYTKTNENVGNLGVFRNGLIEIPVHPEVFHNLEQSSAPLKFDERFSIAADAHFLVNVIVNGTYKYFDQDVSNMEAGGRSQNPEMLMLINKEKNTIISENRLSISVSHQVKNYTVESVKLAIFRILGPYLYQNIKYNLVRLFRR
ncbi:hypothetical protein N9769_01145 [Ascidiaceihabitans sp.]|nr:hypothetical protein [Ascidiaceihabitans sp.]